MGAEYLKLLRVEFINLSSRLVAAVEALINLGGYIATAYLSLTGAATWQVLTAGGLSALITVLLVYAAGESAWQKEHSARMAAGAKVGSGIRPSLLVTYDSPKLVGVVSGDEIPNHPLVIHNEGARAALNVTFEPLIFNANMHMQIADIPMIGPYDHASAKFRVDVTTDEGTLTLDTPDNLGWAVMEADLMARRKGIRQNAAWPLIMTYVDSDGRLYRREFIIEFDTISRFVNLRFKG